MCDFFYTRMTRANLSLLCLFGAKIALFTNNSSIKAMLYLKRISNLKLNLTSSFSYYRL